MVTDIQREMSRGVCLATILFLDKYSHFFRMQITFHSFDTFTNFPVKTCSMVDVLFIENDRPLSHNAFSLLTEDIPGAMIEKSKRFRRWQDAQAYLFGRFLLIVGLRKYGFSKSVLQEIQYTRYNRPYLNAEIDFNISHSGKFIVCAIGKSLTLGIDIEEVRPVDINDFADQFTREEWRMIESAVDHYHEFFNYWTIKEAVIKADGRGLNIPLKDIVIRDHASVEGKDWFIHRIHLDQSYITHLVTDKLLDDKITLRRISMPNDIVGISA
jgi:4'-phosphopantetheinyl transferase